MASVADFDELTTISGAARKFKRSLLTIRRAIRRCGIVPKVFPGVVGKFLDAADMRAIRADLKTRKPAG